MRRNFSSGKICGEISAAGKFDEKFEIMVFTRFRPITVRGVVIGVAAVSSSFVVGVVVVVEIVS